MKKQRRLVLATAYMCCILSFVTGETGTMKQEKHQYVPDPIINTDIPDPDVIRVGDTFYMSSTTMYFSPGCPIMKSKNLVDWTICSYVYDVLEDTDSFSLRNGKNAYGRGSWASSLRYNKGTFYVLFMSFTSNKSYIYETKDIEHGEWKRHTYDTIFYDASLFFDDDGRVYIVRTADGSFFLTEMTADLKIASDKKFIASTELKAGLKGEGVHIQKVRGYYFLFVIAWPQNSMRTEFCFRSKTIEGPYEKKIVLQDEGAAQGGIVDAVDGKWYGFVFKDHGPVGRTPVLVPVTWVEDWPLFGVNGKVPHDMAYPVAGATGSDETDERYAIVTSDDFDEQKLRVAWQWNHNPDNANWSLTERPGFMRLRNGAVYTPFTQVRNMLTERTYGPYCSGTTCIDTAHMKDGDCAGLAALQAKYAYVAVKKESGKKYIVMVNTYDKGHDTFEEKEEERVEVPATDSSTQQTVLYLKEAFNFPANTATFFYSTDGSEWKQIGKKLSMVYSLKHFTGYRFALFNQATKEKGGYVDFDYLHVADK